MTLCERLISTFPPNVNRMGVNFRHVVANINSENDRQSDVEQHDVSYYYGAIEHALYEAEKYCDSFAAVKDVYELDDELFDKAKKYFCPNEIQYYMDKILKPRLKAMFTRGHMEKWGSWQNLVQVFKELFPDTDVHYLVNTNDDENNRIINGSFESDIGAEWSITGTVDRSREIGENFDGVYGCKFNSAATISQAVAITSNTAQYLHFFSKGDFSVEIKSTVAWSNRYWNNETHEWQSTQIANRLESSNEYKLHTIKIGKVSSNSITIKFKNESDSVGYIDYIRLFGYLGYPEFEILVHAKGSSGSNVFTLINPLNPPMTITPILPGVYGPTTKKPFEPDSSSTKGDENSFYLGNSTSSSLEFMNFILDYLKPAGVQARLNRITEESTGEQEGAYVLNNILHVPYGEVENNDFINNQDVNDNTLNA